MAKPKLYTTDEFGELWLENPLLITAGNPRRSKMAARKPRRRKYRRAKRNGGLIMNGRKRKYTRRSKARHNPRPARRRASTARARHYFRRNRRASSGGMKGTSFFGISLPPMDAVLFTGVGFVAPPLVSNFVLARIPAQYATNPGVVWAVKAASAIVPPMIVKRFVSQRAGNMMLLGGFVSLAIELVRTYMPGVIPGLSGQPFLGKYYETQQYTQNRGMGKYITRPNAPRLSGGNGGNRSASIFGGVPERLMPQNRF